MAEMLIDGAKLDACLDAEADAIRAKTGDSNDIAFDFANNKGFADAIAAIPTGARSAPNIAGFLSLVPAFDDTWTVAPFSLLSYPSSGQLSVPNPLGEIPDYAVVIKTDISLQNDLGGVIGGYNFNGYAKTDNALNRNIVYFAADSTAGGGYANLREYGMFGKITINNWSMVGNATPAWTNELIWFRCGTGKNNTNGYCLGEYILAVKKVSE